MSPNTVNSTERHLFPAGVQKGKEYVEVFSSSGSDPTSWWHVKDQSKSSITRRYSHDLKSYYISIGADVALPRAPQTLHLLQSNLIFQVQVPAISQGFRANITCTTIEGSKRCIFVSSMLKTPLLGNNQRKSLPMSVESDVWINIVIDMQDLVAQYFKERFAHLDRIELHPTMRLRRIWTQMHRPSEQDFAQSSRGDDYVSQSRVPVDLLLPSDCQSITMIMDSKSVPSKDKTVPKKPERRVHVSVEPESQAWESEAAESSGNEHEHSLVIGQGLLLSAEERQTLDQALEDLDETSSVDSATWNLIPKKKWGGGLREEGSEDMLAMHMENSRLLAAKRRADAKIRGIEKSVERLKATQEHPEIEDAVSKMKSAQYKAVSAETALEDTWKELCVERGRNRGMEEELRIERSSCLSWRAQVKSLQALLLQVDGHSKVLSKELQLRDRSLTPMKAEWKAEKEAMMGKIKELQDEISSEDGGVASLQKVVAQRDEGIEALKEALARSEERVKAQEDLRQVEAEEHASAARSWAREMAEMRSHVRGLDTTIAELQVKEEEGKKAKERGDELQRLLDLRTEELERMDKNAGAVVREVEIMKVELHKAREAVRRAHVERDAEGERLHREQVLQFARVETRHERQVARLRERSERAEKLYRMEWLRRKDRGMTGAGVELEEEKMEEFEEMSTDSLMS